MKKFLYSILAFAAISFAGVSCVQEEPHKPGEPDADGCYGVYFPAQATDLNLDPADALTTEIAVVRTVSTGDITVPVTLIDEAGVFSISPLTFEDGQTESYLELSFDKADVGITYTCSLVIEDPQYASNYSANPVHLDFSVLREKWNTLGMAQYTDDFITTFFAVPAGATYEVEAQENDLIKGFYRFKNVWGASYPYNEDGDYDASKDYWFYIHAENPSMVYFDYQDTGMNWGYGNFGVWCLAGYYTKRGENAKAAEYFGTIKDGVIKFPASSLLLSMADYNDAGLYTSNANGLFKIVLPGGKDVDYTLKAATGISVDGNLPVQLTLGADIATVKYAVYEGSLNSAQESNYANAIAGGTEPNAKTAEGDAFSISMEKTGVYTIVFVGFDAAGAAQSSTSAKVSYVAKGEEVPVVVSAGLAATDKYTPQGNTSQNSLEYYVYGTDLTSVQIGLFKYVDLAADYEGCVAAVRTGAAPVSEETLALINGEGYVDLFTSLNPGTEYCMLVLASNGYEEAVVLAAATTEGDPIPVYMDYSVADMAPELQPANSEGYFGTYNYYAVDAAGTLGMREYIGQATISDSERADVGPDENGLYDEYVNITGFFAAEAEALGFKDEQIWDYYGGYLYNLAEAQPLGEISLQGASYYGHLFVSASDGSLYKDYDMMLIGGYVADGYIAFASSELYNGGVLGEDGLFLGAFADAEYSSYAGGLAGYYNILLVDPEKDDNGLAPAAASAAMNAKLLDLNMEINRTPVNCVETTKGRIRSIIDKFNSTPRNYACNVAGLKNAERTVNSVDFTVGEAMNFEVQRTFKPVENLFVAE